MPTALISVSDKTGLVDFAKGLSALGWKLLASGGTAKAIRDAGIDATEVATYAGSPEILGGRVKTLHPAIHGGILARGTDADAAELARQGWGYIDLVAVNLYPFEATVAKPGVTLAEAIEEIDIGGVALIRAAAKNHDRVTLVCDPADYGAVLDEFKKSGSVSPETRTRLARKGFARTAAYDSAIFAYLDPDGATMVRGYSKKTLRYGENPHQEAEYWSLTPGGGPLGGEVLQGKELSYNNILDLDAAWRAVESLDGNGVVIVKHLSPCGIAEAPALRDAVTSAIASDPVSAFGGVIAVNRVMDSASVEALGELFVECIAAVGFDDGARALLSKRKNARLVSMGNAPARTGRELRTVAGGFLSQSPDSGDPAGTEWKVVSKRQPTDAELAALRFAWKACTHVKSNAIVFARGTATVGIGGGQPNRVDCVRIAVNRAGEKSKGAVMASDAFFPFPDSIEEAAKAGVTAVVHPGGSIRDDLSVAAADAAGMAMVVTGVRHFRH